MRAIAQRIAMSLTFLALFLPGAPASAQHVKPPSAGQLGVPVYPRATFIQAFTAGPLARYLYASNDLAIQIARFYERKTGRKAERTTDPDGLQIYRIVVKGPSSSALPGLEIRVNHYPGGSIIPDRKGETQLFAATFVISKKIR